LESPVQDPFTKERSGPRVAVKRLNHDSEHVPQAFLAEISSISQIRHRNLVHLQGWCYEYRHFLLVFDYMGNGSLDEWLFPTRRRHPSDPKYKTFEVLPWELRFSIFAGVAAAVEYLHEEWVKCVLHRDIKSSNVMLDADFNPHLGDFGLARLQEVGQDDHDGRDVWLHGPRDALHGQSHLGVRRVQLRKFSGRKPVNLQVEVPDEDFMLVQNVWRAREAGNILAAVHPRLLHLHSHQLNNSMNVSLHEPSSNSSLPVITSTVVPLLQLGLQCCLLSPESRPPMRVVQQAIMQLGGSCPGEDTMTILSTMPPLPSSIPVYGFVPLVP
jgi:serine/threonine protein kinase